MFIFTYPLSLFSYLCCHNVSSFPMRQSLNNSLWYASSSTFVQSIFVHGQMLIRSYSRRGGFSIIFGATPTTRVDLQMRKHLKARKLRNKSMVMTNVSAKKSLSGSSKTEKWAASITIYNYMKKNDMCSRTSGVDEDALQKGWTDCRGEVWLAVEQKENEEEVEETKTWHHDCGSFGCA